MTPIESEGGTEEEAALAAAAAELDEVEAALGRLEDGSFDTCQICGAPIGRQRLLQDPLLTRCPQHSGGGAHEAPAPTQEAPAPTQEAPALAQDLLANAQQAPAPTPDAPASIQDAPGPAETPQPIETRAATDGQATDERITDERATEDEPDPFRAGDGGPERG